MIRQTLSTASTKNKESRELPLNNRRETNTAWLARALADLALDNMSSWSFVLLMGSRDIGAFRLRFAQSPIRRDMLPSYWSDCALVDIPDNNIAQATLITLPLLQPANASFTPARNGLVSEPISKLAAHKYPNLALLALPVERQHIMEAVATYRVARQAYDAVKNILPWLGFMWGSDESVNPLLQNIGLPSAVMINQIFSTQGFDLAPGVNSQTATPEAFWSAASYWQDYYRDTQSGGRYPQARYVIGHAYDIDEN